MGRREPLVETRGMELVFTSLASQSGERVVGRVDDGIADRAFLHPLKLPVHILLPHLNGLQQCSILESFTELLIRFKILSSVRFENI